MKNKRGFTIIELLVVIAVIGILVLLAIMNFLGKTESARIAQIKNDIVAYEKAIDVERINDNNFINDWEEIDKSKLNEYVLEKTFYSKKGIVKELTDELYFEIPKDKIKIKSHLKGEFYLSNENNVYYNEEHIKNSDEDETQNDEVTCVYTQDEIKNKIKEGYKEIKNVEDLNNINNDLAGKYFQTADIDLSLVLFEPIGDEYQDIKKPFTGIYDGGKCKIKNMSINQPSTGYNALFRAIKNATIENVKLENVNVKGRGATASLAGYASESTINNSYAIGNITGTAMTGGLVGSVTTKTLITNSYANVNITSNGYYVGGLVGSLMDSEINNSYASGSVESSDKMIGGLVGLADDVYGPNLISNSYATGDVIGYEQVGGLFGAARQGTKVINSYATGKVIGDDYTGGIVGVAKETIFENCYWDEDTTGHINLSGYLSSGNGMNSGKTTSEMKIKTTYDKWDFLNTWKIKDGHYPQLKWEK